MREQIARWQEIAKAAQHQGRLTGMTADPAPSTATCIRPCRTSRRCCRISTTFWRDSVVERGIDFARNRSAIRRSRRSRRGRNGAARTASPRPTPAQLARAGVRPLAGRHRDPQLPLRRASAVQRGHGERVLRARSTTGSPRNGSTAIRGCAPRSSMPMQNVEYAVDEIERCAKDKRFVQVLVLAMQEVPLGRRHFWPIYAACRAPRPAARHPCRLRLPQSGHVARLAELLHRGLRQPVARLPVAGREPDLRRRVRQVSRAQGGADRIGRDVAARVPVAVRRNSGAGFAPRCRGSTVRRGRSCATISG